ncbi:MULTISPECIES: type II toxin-antitoxin system Phd/YefM family antitoxin [unclassified Mesorhizobium]|uniref:type II toxin-antitoxin system Phd/YefM family antitoxin n=1 Tax=unclassified Mesorhizobium TaxID=325217 RepID=UPI000F756A6F|nr:MULTISPECIES: type II toxin-antitoxin system Phd/YefM family antitoxin [unclassified Mesorhizobium]AZO02641.1 type II toxin-antitoxin system Phd/YefM family antitoxin [Mesorhizobium sp. M2A.F.Ca.ET.043.02.1.1]RUW39888.1 type II toxin-antitoxin system Phd/YefM family antitoxin [Mesorhizobium sp. M2A.F.Ca.ET.015.02.1.1]RUW66620.1 type II toxin-antitoxin system Phd/YefM family antitoxin [Mesorhizobium sp. M2A.F.Ca.ET.067.02.1.1]RVC91540.1 type II toxin-antitoxin system Phd/YefM family antitoxin
MKQYPSTDLKQNLGDVLAAASQQPVSITRHNKPRYVLMSIEAYEARFVNDSRRAYAAKDAPSEHVDMLEEYAARGSRE